MNDPRRWTASELARDVEQAKAEFRRRRLHEPLDVYSRFFRTFAPIFADVIDRLPALIRNPCDPAVVGELVRDGDVRTAFRYLAAPPVSEDDDVAEGENNTKAVPNQRPRPRGGCPKSFMCEPFKEYNPVWSIQSGTRSE